MSDSEPRLRHADSSAVISPKFVSQGQEFEVQLCDWADFASRTVEVHIGPTCPPSYLTFRPLQVELDSGGNGVLQVAQGFNVAGLWGAHVAHLTCGERALIPANNPGTLVNWDGPELSDGEVQLVQQDLSSQNRLLHSMPFGDSNDASNRLHRAVTLLTGVLTTQHIIYPGVITIPLEDRPVDREHLDLLNGFLQSLKLPVFVEEDKWVSSKSSRYPTTAVLIPQIWARDFDDAHRIASDAIERIQLVLAVHRLAKASPVALIIEQRQADDSSRSRVHPHETHYEGNLIGGYIAGEDPEVLSRDFERMSADPLVRLCASLFAEAIAETNEDFKFFKYWAVLETMFERLGQENPVSLVSGEPWPEKPGPLDPGPKVYSMIVKVLSGSGMTESGIASPSSDLYELVQVLKARRNATAHYGGFDPNSAAQQSRRWYADALKSIGSTLEWLEWLDSARWLSNMVLSFSLPDGA